MWQRRRDVVPETGRSWALEPGYPESRTGRAGALASPSPEIVHTFGRSADSGRRIELAATCERPGPLPVDQRVCG